MFDFIIFFIILVIIVHVSGHVSFVTINLFNQSHRYSVEPGDTGVGLGCVVRVRPGQLSRDDIEVTRIEQLNCPLSLGPGEELVSNIVEIRSHSNAVDINCVRVSVCVCPHLVFPCFAAFRSYIHR